MTVAKMEIHCKLCATFIRSTITIQTNMCARECMNWIGVCMSAHANSCEICLCGMPMKVATLQKKNHAFIMEIAISHNKIIGCRYKQTTCNEDIYILCVPIFGKHFILQTRRMIIKKLQHLKHRASTEVPSTQSLANTPLLLFLLCTAQWLVEFCIELCTFQIRKQSKRQKPTVEYVRGC